ncbi:hypothetical protein R1T16_11225 [Flavobacterium sp. DG1-102-2]|uniref:hypothetical protein n=1 Tax=Flavobacterium sp. DG1-102-2 TaxID=3081663 RepID=UPI002948D8B3|nr:hypothetical protein [Flavobacterium sp. DG1-102-2]MDV6169000.1 hypothetical protein [Flavobacterium sp. DG1-102-2]
MKKILGLALALICLAGCSDDDSPKNTVNLNQLNKRWYYVATWVNGKKTDHVNEACGKDYLEFLEGGVAKNVDIYNCQLDPEITNGTYTIDANTNKLTTVLDGETIIYTVNKLNSKELEAETTFNGLKIGYVFTSTP